MSGDSGDGSRAAWFPVVKKNLSHHRLPASPRKRTRGGSPIPEALTQGGSQARSC